MMSLTTLAPIVNERIMSFLLFSTLAQSGGSYGGVERAGGNALGIWGLPAGWWWVWLMLAFVLIVIGGSLATGRIWTRNDLSAAATPPNGKTYKRGFSGALGWLVILVGIVVAGLVWWRADLGPHYAVNPPAASHTGKLGYHDNGNSGRVNG
jgi:hypothetical protein